MTKLELMKFELSSCVSLSVPNREAATAFYASLLGDPIEEEGEIEFSSDELRIFIDEGEPFGPVLEFLVEDLDEARARVLALGCEILRWGGLGMANYIRDPNGICWNLYQES